MGQVQSVELTHSTCIENTYQDLLSFSSMEAEAERLETGCLKTLRKKEKVPTWLRTRCHKYVMHRTECYLLPVLGAYPGWYGPSTFYML